ncbi:MAG: lactonase family protein [Bacteroidia bacterium]|nr:lactonase family protein [Bacteroidia bacterium]
MRFVLLIWMILPALHAAAQQRYLFVGTYTARGSEGIYVYRFDPATGALAQVSAAGGIENPSFLALAPGGKHLYAVEENDPGHVAAFRFDEAAGTLVRIGRQPAEGVWPCHLAVDAGGRWCIAGNYGSGSLAVLPILPDGSLGPAVQTIRHSGSGPNAERQEGPHVHSVNFSPDGRQIFVADLGTDELRVYQFDAASGRLTPGDPPAVRTAPGGGPRHFAFHPGGSFAYAVLELTSQVAAFRYENGTLSPIQTERMLPAGFSGPNTCADLHVSPDGRFLYGSNRGHNSIAVFAIHPRTGRLTPKGHQPTLGSTPRNFAIDPTGRYLLAANQESGDIQVFRRNPRSGKLTPAGQSAKVSMPVCLLFR